MTGQPGTYERGQHSRRSGKDIEIHICIEACLHETVTGIGNTGHSRIADESDHLPGLRSGSKFRRLAGFIVLMEGQQRLA